MQSTQVASSTTQINPWLALLVPPFALVLGVLIAQVVLVWKVRADSQATLDREMRVSAMELLRERLSGFYDPIYVCLRSTHAVFESFGPKSFPKEETARAEAVTVWDHMIETVIKPNNARTCELIMTKCHLLHSSDSIEHYIDFVEHACSYATFRVLPTSRHLLFGFPQDFPQHVYDMRKLVGRELGKHEKGTA